VHHQIPSYFSTLHSHGQPHSNPKVHLHNNTLHSLPPLLHTFFLFFLFFFFTLLHCSRHPTPKPFSTHHPSTELPNLLPQEHSLHHPFHQTRTLQEEKNKEKQEHDEAQKEDGGQEHAPVT